MGPDSIGRQAEPSGTPSPRAGLPPGERSVRLAERPSLSVIVASSGDRALLETCLSGLLRPCAEHEVELVVARACGPTELGELASAYPRVQFIAAPEGSTTRDLRVTGMAGCAGDVVAIVEDHRTVHPDRLRQLAGAPALAAVGDDADADSEERRGVDWTAYFAGNQANGGPDSDHG
jgi:hypothetical protein